MKSGRDKVIEALNLARMGDIGRANRLLQGMRNHPDFEADACYGLGLIELCQNNLDNADAYFGKATQLDPTHADAYYQQAKIADMRGDPVTAMLYLKSALAQKPGHAMAAEALSQHDDVVGSEVELCDRGSNGRAMRAPQDTLAHTLSKSGVNWKTAISMITLAILTIGAVHAT